MEMHQLRYFVAVAREGNFTRAARACHVSQPSLSQQIKKLEEELGQSLLHRLKSGKSVLSPAGELFFPRAVRILQEANTAAAELEQIGDKVSGSVRMGAIPTLAPYLVPDAALHFNRDYPDVELVIHETTTADLLNMLWRNELDFALASPPFAGGPWEMQYLGTEPLLLATAAQVTLEAELHTANTNAKPTGAILSAKSASAKGDVGKVASTKAKTVKGGAARVAKTSADKIDATTVTKTGTDKTGATKVAKAGAGKTGGENPPASGVLLSDLSDEEFILMREGHCLSDQVLGLCQQADFRPRVRFLSAQVETLKALIRAGTGVSLLPLLAIDPADTTLRTIRLDDTPEPHREIVALWRPEFPLSRASTEFVRVIRQTLEKKLKQG